MPTQRRILVNRAECTILFKTDLGVDLFAALKGGGNNFGIVTAYTLQTHPQDHKVNRVQLY
jgi:FAD/FMN-containing dehydrogenase